MLRFVAMVTFAGTLQSLERHIGYSIYCCGNWFHVVVMLV